MYLFIKFINDKSLEFEEVHSLGNDYRGLFIVKDRSDYHTNELQSSFDFGSGACLWCSPQMIIPKRSILWYTLDKKFKEFMEPSSSRLNLPDTGIALKKGC